MKSNSFSPNPGATIGLALMLFSGSVDAADYALSFNSTLGQSVSIPHESAQNAYPLTVMCWFQEPNGSSGGGALVNKYTSGSMNGWMIAIADAGHQTIDEWTPTNNSVTTLVLAGLGDPTGVAVAGNDGLVFEEPAQLFEVPTQETFAKSDLRIWMASAKTKSKCIQSEQ